jgi:hypothetical protein
MTYAVVVLAFLAGLLVTGQRGLAAGFAWVYVPVLLFLSGTAPIDLPSWPDVGPVHAVLYGILFGSMMNGGRLPTFRWAPVDTLIIGVAACYVISGMFTEELYTGVSLIGEKALEWVIPYFVARMTFQSEQGRADTLKVLVACLVVLAFFALVEFRLWPYWLSRHMQDMGLWTGANELAYHRFGFFRAQTTFQHPIDLGNVGLLLTGMVPLLASTTRYGLRSNYVRVGWACAAILLVTSISFTAYLGLSVAVTAFVVTYKMRWPRTLIMPLVVLGIMTAIGYTAYVVTRDLGPRPADTDLFAASLWIRKLIVQRAWGLCSTAGLFGWGKIIDMRELKLSSVDNAYLLMTMTRGWLTVGLFLLIPVALARRVGQSFRRAYGARQVLPLSIAIASICGVMAAMYTVWFGFVYANIFFVMVAFTATLTEFYLTQPAPVAAPEPAFPTFDEMNPVPLMHQTDAAPG